MTKEDFLALEILAHLFCINKNIFMEHFNNDSQKTCCKIHCSNCSLRVYSSCIDICTFSQNKRTVQSSSCVQEYRRGEVASPFHYGSVTERLMVPILKIGNRDERFVGSNPTASAIKGCSLMVKYRSPKP